VKLTLLPALPVKDDLVLAAQLAAVDAMNEADPAGKHASEQTLTAGQAAVDALNAKRGRK
jgi:hypothetical protein